MPPQLDHIGLLVGDTSVAIASLAKLGLSVVAEEEIATPPARLTYLEAPPLLIQLVEPTGPSHLLDTLRTHGEGLHHLCFQADDPAAAATALGDANAVSLGRGLGGRRSAFAGPRPHGLRIEFTEPDPPGNPDPTRAAK